MLPSGAGRHEPACRGCAPAPRRAAWGTVPGPPGPTMARPQRTPARSPDNIVEVKSKVRAPLAPAPASALGASNSLILPFPSFSPHHLFSRLHHSCPILRPFLSPSSIHLLSTAGI